VSSKFESQFMIRMGSVSAKTHFIIKIDVVSAESKCNLFVSSVSWHLTFAIPQDFIDIQNEIGKLTSKKDRLQGSLKKIQDSMARDDYLTKVPEGIRQENDTKVRYP
jgi:valyl-tRNA synthetase